MSHKKVSDSTMAYGEFSQYYDFLGWNAFAKASAIRLQSFFG